MSKLILFGDSITAGYMGGEITLILNQHIKRYLPNLEVINAGLPGDTTRGAVGRVGDHVVRYNPDVVTVFFGANDVADHSGINNQEYRQNLVYLINTIGADKMVLVGPPFMRRLLNESDRPYRRINEYNGIAKELAILNRIPFVDLFSVMQGESEPEVLWQADGLHFSKQGYLLLGRLLAEELKRRGIN
ncbi:hypothetical protein CBF34_00475 [Vagococcus penaei]|uniref:Uncharacterized protein n=1 Tax=Vagococcus penaei TaxID=633807 RepID=A0A1Q2D586_9ENTE|nr:GDSL-type esterase/lipase family protein [Vagococcus penaei]AQP53572.1 hypothetical protein BW732_04555 [Vagococcus penaei]RSU07516.1 hypothetical protein CBF34_00475 [Vagococcus penaei]